MAGGVTGYQVLIYEGQHKGHLCMALSIAPELTQEGR